MNEVISIHAFHVAHPVLFWLVAIIGFPEIEIIALVSIAIGTFNL